MAENENGDEAESDLVVTSLLVEKRRRMWTRRYVNTSMTRIYTLTPTLLLDAPNISAASNVTKEPEQWADDAMRELLEGPVVLINPVGRSHKRVVRVKKRGDEKSPTGLTSVEDEPGLQELLQSLDAVHEAVTDSIVAIDRVNFALTQNVRELEATYNVMAWSNKNASERES